MFDLTSRITYKSIPKWHRDLQKVVSNIPVVLVGNKADEKSLKIRSSEIEYAEEAALQYYEISALTNYQFELPFLYILRYLVGDPNLDFVSQPKYFPEEEQMAESEVNNLEDRWRNFQKTFTTGKGSEGFI